MEKKSGERVKQIRMMCGLSREDFSLKVGISKHTIQSWEQNKTSLSSKGAEKLVSGVETFGVICSEQWLLFSLGAPPRYIHDSKSIESFPEKLVKVSDTLYEEISVFEKMKDSYISIISDDSMFPYYNIGDYVGGLKVSINKSIIRDYNFIIKLDNKTVVRKIAIRDDDIVLYPVNPMSTAEEPYMVNPNINLTYAIIWHRKLAMKV
ncbi:helix-turn-helix domain-containing protein [Fangia hongkongensis]|uniref:helix-turn-helix domain-containing protein n=1 Tax=Fangia hongkongensis TaxID=270495 RepID=UPI0003644804|nr:helix-turn-helix domain-containing protein [Fangia hongkongensis]MBK2124461.1 helix-turn-helix domain-containing protein [Fangia hongkongensis]